MKHSKKIVLKWFLFLKFYAKILFMLSKKLLKELNILYLRKEDSEDAKIKRVVGIFFKKLYCVEKEDKALEIFKNIHISLILIDIDYKQDCGLDFVKMIRKEDKKIPIIVITKNTKLPNLLSAIKLNLTDYLIKPLDISDFINALNEAAKVIFAQTKVVTIVPNIVRYNYVNKSIYQKNIVHKLTKYEARLIEFFLQNPNTLLKKEDIKKAIWKEKGISESGFKSLLKRVSDKLGEKVIENSFGIGYSFSLK